MKLAPPQIQYYAEELKRHGVVHCRMEQTACKVLAGELDEVTTLQVLATFPEPTPPRPPAPPTKSREESKQQIIDRTLAWMEETNADDPWETPWTAEALSAAIPESNWNEGGHPIDYDLGLLADAINSQWNKRHPIPSERKPEIASPDEDSAEDEEESPNGTPFLLPIANMDGYSVDPWGRPHGDKRRGRKAGALALDKFFTSKGRKDKTRRFVCGYKVRVGDKRKRYRPTYFIMARLFAEQKWINGE